MNFKDYLWNMYEIKKVNKPLDIIVCKDMFFTNCDWAQNHYKGSTEVDFEAFGNTVWLPMEKADRIVIIESCSSYLRIHNLELQPLFDAGDREAFNLYITNHE